MHFQDVEPCGTGRGRGKRDFGTFLKDLYRKTIEIHDFLLFWLLTPPYMA